MTNNNEMPSSAFVSNPEICVAAVPSPPINSAFVSNPEIRVAAVPSLPIKLKSETSSEIIFIMHNPGNTLTSGKPNTVKLTHGRFNTLTVFTLPRDSEIGDWRLKSIILAQIRHTRKEWLATTWLEGIAEYGVGEDTSDAIIDLVVSLGEYRESLEKQEANLGDSAQRELDHLRRIIERRSINNLT